MTARLLGTLLLPLAGWMAGDAVRQKTREHLCSLEQSIHLLQRIRQEIEFRRADLACLAQQLKREGVLEKDAGTGGMPQFPAPAALSREEQACFAECMSCLGRTEAEQECQRLDYYIARFREFRRQAEQSAQAQAGLPRRVGFAAGTMLMIFFL